MSDTHLMSDEALLRVDEVDASLPLISKTILLTNRANISLNEYLIVSTHFLFHYNHLFFGQIFTDPI